MRKVVAFFLYLTSLLPFAVLYFISDLLYLSILVFGYRRAVVRKNIADSFPEYNEAERLKIERRFYQMLCDLTIETLKTSSISSKTIRKRVVFEETEGYKHYQCNRDASIILTGHFSNWEWAGLAIGLATQDRPVQVVYLKIRNPFFNDLIQNLRQRFGNIAIHMENVYRNVLRHRDQGIVSCFLADQTPQPHKIGYWGDFLNRKTAFFNGPEKLAKKINIPVYCANVAKTGRGRYRIYMQLLTDNPASTPENYVMDNYVKFMEASIRRQPYNWLWSHRRWKHRWNGETS